jgi:hypothetical protein
VKHGFSIGAVLIAMSIIAAGAPAVAAPTGLGDQQQKHEKAHRSNWEQIIRNKVMGVVTMVEGGIAEARARAKMKAAMAAKAEMAAKAKQEAAMAAKAKQGAVQQQ